ncbi:MAG: lysophospholipid acyltransferase family protein [Planctomycetota bacterium]|nr:lysophospholipid acyltransferase family protein [Planctomycetota bacterium]
MSDQPSSNTPAQPAAASSASAPPDALGPFDAHAPFSGRPLWLERLGVGLLRTAVAGARALPPEFTRAAARLAGRAVYYGLGPDFMDVRRHLRIAFREELDDRRRREIARDYWMHLCETLAESARLATWTRETVSQHVDLADERKLADLRASGRGAIVASGHLGSWEVGPYAFALLGYPIKLLHNPGTVAPFLEFVNEERQRSGMEVLSKQIHPWRLKKLLDKGTWLCMACDINNTRRGDQVPFFGTLASSYVSHAALQEIAKCPIVVTSTSREPGGRHRFHCWRIFEYDPARKGREAQRRLTLEIHRALEEAIRAYPEQWLWHSRRWRSRPVNEGEPDAEGLPPRCTGDWWATIDWEAYLVTGQVRTLPPGV